MSSKQKKGLFLIILIVIIAVIIWILASVWIAPKLVLRAAIRSAFFQLEERFSEHPASILADLINNEGRYHAETDLCVRYSKQGETGYCMDIDLDLVKNQIWAEGMVSPEEDPFSLSVYLDRDMLAVGSDRFEQGQTYGLRYGSFPSDVCKIPLLGVLAEYSVFDHWAQKLALLQSLMEKQISVPQIPKISGELLEGLLLGVVILPCEMEETSCWLDPDQICRKVTYHISDATVPEVLDMLGDSFQGNKCSLTVSCYLYRNSLIQADVEAVTENETFSFSLMLMEDASEGAVGLRGIVRRDADVQAFSVFVNTKNDENHISETWRLFSDYAGTQPVAHLAYTWNRTSGNLALTVNGTDAGSLAMKPNENGMTLISGDYIKLISLFSEEANGFSGAPRIYGTVNISRGAAVSVPVYKNLDQWSLEELLLFLTVVGPLLGWDIS